MRVLLEPTGTLQNWSVNPQYHRTFLTLQDDGVIALDWFKWDNCKTRSLSAPIVLVLHAITGTLPEVKRYLTISLKSMHATTVNIKQSPLHPNGA